jgi:methylglutaconyl-CoA hydratase
MTATLRLEAAGPIARVTLNRPEVRNAFNDGVIAELTEAFKTLGQRETCASSCWQPKARPSVPVPT